jgi:hypothetical protein
MYIVSSCKRHYIALFCKYNMKKIIVGIFSFALLLVAQNAGAVTVWNGAAADCRGIAIADQTTNTGIVNPCWPLSSVSANADDSINVRIYYHNTSGDDATNVRILVTAPTAASNSFTFSGQIISDQGNASLGTVTANTASGSTVIFGGAHWLPNQSQTESAIPFGQTSNGSEVINNGLRIGTIASSWPAQGSVVVTFRVNKPAPTGVITAATPSCVIAAGQSTCPISFSWNTVNPVNTSSVTKDGVTGDYKTGNSATNVPFPISNGSSNFRLYNNGLELSSASVTAYCVSGANWDSGTSTCKLPVYDCKINSFTSSKGEVTAGEVSVLTWTTENCNNVSISNVGSGLPSNSYRSVWPTTTTTYVLTGYGNTGVVPTSQIQIMVGGPAGAPGYPAGAPGYSY